VAGVEQDVRLHRPFERLAPIQYTDGAGNLREKTSLGDDSANSADSYEFSCRGPRGSADLYEYAPGLRDSVARAAGLPSQRHADMHESASHPRDHSDEAQPSAAETLTPDERRERIRLLQRLPVTVSVRLAEKKVEMTALLGLTPGTLITFNKSCEDLLDLYVNNQLYCRGEAVKIGEKFGLKINEVGAKPVQEEHVFNW
jgi:flagellar motor switch protein FliN/FliY